MRATTGYLALLLALLSASCSMGNYKHQLDILRLLFQAGFILPADEEAIKVVDTGIAHHHFKIGKRLGTNGHIFKINTTVPRPCLRPGIAALCTFTRNEGWNLNEWLVHNLWTAGFDHVVIYDDNSTDNTRDVLKPWVEAGLVSLRATNRSMGMVTQWESYQRCFQEFGPRYKWLAHFDTDEWLMALDPPCVADILSRHEARAGLQIGWSMLAADQLFASRGHKTIFEVSNFTLGQPHPLVKVFCSTRNSNGGAWNMAHCCDPKEGFHVVDADGDIVVHKDPKWCWELPHHKGRQPRANVTILHTRGTSFEEFMHRRLRRLELPAVFDDTETREGIHIVKAWSEYRTYLKHEMVSLQEPTPRVLRQMHDFSSLLNSVLVSRDRLAEQSHSGSVH